MSQAPDRVDNRRILVVDDNSSIHEDFKKILLAKANAGQAQMDAVEQDLFGEAANASSLVLDFDLDFASQGEEAVQKVIAADQAGKPYAMVFMDARMPPGIDGITTVARIWEKVPNIEVVICTAYSDHSLEDIIAKLGQSEHLLLLKKPFDSAEVLLMAISQTKKWGLNLQNRLHTENLEALVKQRTDELDVIRAVSIRNGQLTALGEMAGGVAHEINNPLAMIFTNGSLLKNLIEKKYDQEKALTFTGRILDAAERVTKIVKGLQAFSKSGDDEGAQTVRVQSMVDDMLNICREKIKSRGVELDVKVSSADLEMECRPSQIKQTLLNLITNSLEAVEKLETKWIRIQVAGSSTGLIAFSVTDSGKGLAPGAKEKVFQPFYTTKSPDKGTGLGLSVALGYVQAHGGRLWVDESCANTRFVFELPARMSQKQAEVA